MLRGNDSDSFPGANWVGADPVTSGECCQRQSIALMAAAAAALGLPYTIKGAQIFLDASPGELNDLCLGDEPAPTSFDADPMDEGAEHHCLGTKFGGVEGKFYLTEASTWVASQNRVQQGGISWGDTDITFTMAGDGLVTTPTKIYGYVENACGRVNAAGLEGTYQEAPK